MKLLVLGGPRFLGRAIANAALDRGHELTFFNRGRTNPEQYPEVEKLVGDREHDLSALAGREWDAVIDTSGYVPRVVRDSAEALASAGRYCFVSSVSVYADFSRPLDEESDVAPIGDDPLDELTPDFSNYGALKALCEDTVFETFDRRALVIRPGLIVGPHDPTGRFTYWPHRLARGGEVLAPERPNRLTQFVDVRDLAEWMIDLCERDVGGTFNATNAGVSWRELLETCRDVAGTDAEFVWVPDGFLVEQGVGEWMELPLWIVDPAMSAADEAVIDRALAAGLRFRPLADTIRATLDEARPTETAGLSPEREAELLAAWHAR
ncbi:MAG: SDR family oxidoreductase [Thermoleophilia bacterium]|nr:SDR family oxidoreductase [Thermoleophilia bacterium]MDH4340750.1 SDR family oxidoreductase [Thermoleophilia bacterium]MDH5279734.1 SDR family oxidoreductase [Thermoleophilia bacterium]